jgi:hypothetical protein
VDGFFPKGRGSSVDTSRSVPEWNGLFLAANGFRLDGKGFWLNRCGSGLKADRVVPGSGGAVSVLPSRGTSFSGKEVRMTRKLVLAALALSTALFLPVPSAEPDLAAAALCGYCSGPCAGKSPGSTCIVRDGILGICGPSPSPSLTCPTVNGIRCVCNA